VQFIIYSEMVTIRTTCVLLHNVFGFMILSIRSINRLVFVTEVVWEQIIELLLDESRLEMVPFKIGKLRRRP